MERGIHGSYQWLEADLHLRDFVTLCPQVVLWRYLAITAADAGDCKLSEHDTALGWTSTGGVAYGPVLQDLAQIPPAAYNDECCKCDEWYVFTSSPGHIGAVRTDNIFDYQMARPDVFRLISFCSFAFTNPAIQPIVDLFWQQLDWIKPESYVGDGNQVLVFVSSDPQLFESVYQAMVKAEAE